MLIPQKHWGRCKRCGLYEPDPVLVGVDGWLYHPYCVPEVRVRGKQDD